MGKTTYCQKLAFDWASSQDKLDESFPEIELLLLLRCHEIKSNIWEAIEEQILPEDMDEVTKNNFFKFVRESQSKVLLVLDGLDEADPTKIPMFLKLAESREFPKCHIVFTSRHESGMRFRRLCDTLWEIVGFTKGDGTSFIVKYFKNMEHLADSLLERLAVSKDFREMMSNPMNTALLCVLCEDFEGHLPKSRTQLYIEIVLCILRRYEKKNGLSNNNEDLIKVYEEELLQLGHMALISLRKGELYIEESKFGNSTALTKFGFLSVQAAGGRRKPCVRYGFLHKSFQEFFAGFYLASKILSGEIDSDTVVTDKRYLTELKQVFLFMSGIIMSQCEETAVCLAKNIAANVNCLGRSAVDSKNEIISSNVKLAFAYMKECVTYKKNLHSRLVYAFGSHLDLKSLKLVEISGTGAGFLSDVLAVNTTLTDLDLSWNGIGDNGARSLSEALQVNTTLTDLDLSGNGIGASGAGFLSKALLMNATLSDLDLSGNGIGDSGADSLSEALTVNATLTHLNLSLNEIDASGVGSLSKALKENTKLTDLNLSENLIGDSGAASISDALKVNKTLTYLNLSGNGIGDFGAVSLSDALKVNTTLIDLDLSRNEIGDSGGGSFSEALTVNTALIHLDLWWNDFHNSGLASLSDAKTTCSVDF